MGGVKAGPLINGGEEGGTTREGRQSAARRLAATKAAGSELREHVPWGGT